MEKNTMNFLSRLLGKKKNGCCGVVIEEVEPQGAVPQPTGLKAPKCCAKEDATESVADDS